MYLNIYIYIYMYMYLNIYIYLHMYVFKCICSYLYIYIRINKYVILGFHIKSYFQTSCSSVVPTLNSDARMHSTREFHEGQTTHAETVQFPQLFFCLKTEGFNGIYTILLHLI